MYLLVLFACVGYAQCVDPNYAVQMNNWNSAGVSGGVPDVTNIYSIISSVGVNSISSSINGSTTLQSEINSCNSSGGGVIIMNSGTYSQNTNQITISSNVILRGATGNREDVLLTSEFRAGGYSDYFIQIIGSNSGLEDLKIEYIGGSIEPYDDISLSSPTFSTVYLNIDESNYRVIGVSFSNTSSQSWLDNVHIYKSGSNPVRVGGNHNTVQNSLFDRCYNKGGGGNGYFHVVGNNNLISGNTMTRLRHIVIDAPCCGFTGLYNVVFNNNINCDINFHDGDNGFNLVEQNISTAPSYAFQGGGLLETGRFSDGHSAPSSENYIYNNDTSAAANTQYGDDVVYKTTGAYNITGGATAGFEDSGLSEPICGGFYTKGQIVVSVPKKKSIISLLISH